MSVRLAVFGGLLAALAIVAGGATAARPLPHLGVISAAKSIRISGTPRTGATVVRFSTTNRSAGPTIVRLKNGVTVKDFSDKLDALQGPPDTLQKYGTLVSGVGIARGHARTLTIALAAATYFVVDTDGNDPKKFPRTSFTVPSGSRGASLPRVGATITLHDFRFSAPASIRRGGLVRIVNRGRQLHFVDAIRVPRGMSAARVVMLLHAGKDSRVKLPDTSLLGLVSPGTINVTRIDLKPGTYVLACFYGSAGSHGKEHTTLGMERAVHVRLARQRARRSPARRPKGVPGFTG